MIAWPPRRAIANACSIVGLRPMTSNATSTPRPPVSSMHLGDGVAVARVDEVGRAELLGQVELRVEPVDRDDPLRALLLRALDRVEADAAAADDRDGVALADVGGVDRGTEAGEHTAADERRARRSGRRRRPSPR